jgi:beta-alanine--pyruvate transaminase
MNAITENVSLANDLDMTNYWMPFTANKQFKSAPRLLKSAKGMYYTTVDGRKVLDGVAGLWCVNAGHGREEIIEAVHNQMMEMDYAPSFQMGHPLAFEAATKLAETVRTEERTVREV